MISPASGATAARAGSSELRNSAAARRRLRSIAGEAASGHAEPDALPACAPRLLTEAQLSSFVQNGFVALPVRELSPEWHASFAESLSEHFFGGGVERLPGRHLVQDAALSELCNTPTVRGALTSILGPDTCSSRTGSCKPTEPRGTRSRCGSAIRRGTR